MTSTGRTRWWTKDSAWWRRSRIVELGQLYGPAGPAVIDWLTCEAKTQGPLRNHDGTVKAGYAAAAHGCFISSFDEVKNIVATAVEIGLLEDFEEASRTFTCRISGWREDVEKATEAERKQRQRATGTSGDNGGHPGTKPSNVPARPTDVPLQGQEQELPPKPPKGAESGEGGQVIKFDRRPVPADRLALAEQLLAGFNETAKTGHGAYTGRGRPSESLTRIIGALTDWPDVTPEEWAEVVKVGLKRTPKFWEGSPTPGVVFGPSVVQRNIDEVRRRRPATAGARLSGIDFLNDRSSDD